MALLSYAVLLPVVSFDFYQDYASQQIEPLTRSLQYHPVRGVFTLGYLTLMSCLVAFQASGRHRQTDNTGQYCVLLTDIPPKLLDVDVESAIEGVVGKERITSMKLLRNPHSFYLRERLYAAEKEYYGRLQEGGQDLASATGKCWRRIGCMKFVQLLGFHRDFQYYEERIAAINQKIKEEGFTHIDGNDAAVCSL